MTKKDETITAYNELATEFIDDFNSRGARTDDILRAIKLVGKQNPKVIEFGCANGRDGKVVLQFTRDYTGIDATPKFIEAAKKNVSAGIFEVADYETYNFPPKLDIIFGFASLIHSNKETVSKLFDKFNTSLNSGGVVYLSMQYGDYAEVERIEEGHKRTFYLYTPELIKELAGNDFETVYEDVQNLNRKWFTIALKRK